MDDWQLKQNKVVGISDMAVSSNPEEVLVTYSLGSCLGVSVYDPQKGIGGMIHCMLPVASVDPVKAQANPAMFVSSGFPLLLNNMFRMGAQKHNLIIKAAGCGQVMDPNGQFKIGERNFTIFRKLLWKNDLMLAAEDVGGSQGRTLTLDISTGITRIKCCGTTIEL